MGMVVPSTYYYFAHRDSKTARLRYTRYCAERSEQLIFVCLARVQNFIVPESSNSQICPIAVLTPDVVRAYFLL